MMEHHTACIVFAIIQSLPPSVESSSKYSAKLVRRAAGGREDKFEFVRPHRDDVSAGWLKRSVGFLFPPQQRVGLGIRLEQRLRTKGGAAKQEKREREDCAGV